MTPFDSHCFNYSFVYNDGIQSSNSEWTIRWVMLWACVCTALAAYVSRRHRHCWLSVLSLSPPACDYSWDGVRTIYEAVSTPYNFRQHLAFDVNRLLAQAFINTQYMGGKLRNSGIRMFFAWIDRAHIHYKRVWSDGQLVLNSYGSLSRAQKIHCDCE